jgi:hypothetical protein
MAEPYLRFLLDRWPVFLVASCSRRCLQALRSLQVVVASQFWNVAFSASALAPDSEAFYQRCPESWIATKKGAGIFPGAKRTREMRSGEVVTYQKSYLLSAMGLAPKSRRLLTAVRAARAAGILAAAAP